MKKKSKDSLRFGGSIINRKKMIAAGIGTAVLVASLSGNLKFDTAESNQVFASETSEQTGVLPSGFRGVVAGISATPEPGSKIKRVGTSFEKVIVGQRVSTVKDSCTSLNVSSSIEQTVEKLDSQSRSMSKSAKMMTDEDYYWLLKIVEAEAGEGDVKSRVLVANVIMNRLERDDFPNTITEVIFENENGVPQFSPTYDGAIYRVTVTEETEEAVKQALNGVDYSEGALFFVQKEAAEKSGVEWFEKDLKRLFKYGVHEYYTYPDTLDIQQ